MFGKYICQVNVLKKDRYYDLPLPTSSAILYNTTSESLDDHGKPEVVHEYARVDGQQLVGDMIPRVSRVFWSMVSISLALIFYH